MPDVTIHAFSELRDAGLSRGSIDRAVRERSLLRVRRGWYATPDVDADVLHAVRCGGSLTCSRALRAHGVWVAAAAPLHVRVAPASHLLAPAPRVHFLSGTSRNGVDDVETALAVAARCLPFEHAVCAIDSALNRGLTTSAALEAAWATPGGRRLLADTDRRSESGLETLARLRLRSRRLRVRVQVLIAGVGRVDLIVGDRLVIELDGDRWHSTAEQREEDRRRDSALVARGYLVMRAGYQRVMHDWRGFEGEILTIVRRDEHLWRVIHRAGLHNL